MFLHKSLNKLNKLDYNVCVFVLLFVCLFETLHDVLQIDRLFQRVNIRARPTNEVVVVRLVKQKGIHGNHSHTS
jgi:hypothetical protein